MTKRKKNWAGIRLVFGEPGPPWAVVLAKDGRYRATPEGSATWFYREALTATGLTKEEARAKAREINADLRKMREGH
jgi:hypothetical protein